MSDFLSTIARCKVEPLRSLYGQLNYRDLTGIHVCVTMDWIDRDRASNRSHRFTERIWKSLLHAAALRKDRTAVFLSENGADPSVPRGVYHRKCYQSYTHKRELDKLAARLAEGTASADDEQDHDDGEQLSLSRSDVKRSLQGGQGETPTCAATSASVPTDPEATARRLTCSKVDKTLGDRCLFCQQARKKVKGVHQTLTSCMAFEACDAIYNAAYVRGDERVLLGVQPGLPDLIAKEISYHRACYMKYTHPFYLQGISEAKVREESGGAWKEEQCTPRRFPSWLLKFREQYWTTLVMGSLSACQTRVNGM